MTTTTTIKTPPGQTRPLAPILPPPGILGWLGPFQQDPIATIKHAADAGDLVRLRLGANYIHLVNHPDYIKQILQDNNRNYAKDTRVIKNIKAFAGENIFTGEGGFWLKRRRLMQPMFHRQQIALFGAVKSAAASELLDEWAALPPDHVLDLDDEMMRITLKIVGRALFSVELTGDSAALGDSFGQVSEYVVFRVRHPFYVPLGVPTARNRRVRASRDTIDTIIDRIIQERLHSTAEHHDLLSLLMSVRDEETGEGLTPIELRREMITMVFAGHETTANTLTWAWYLLSQNPEAEARLHAELDRVLAGRVPTMDDVPALTYTRMVIDETIRLYPPAWIFGRAAHQTDALGEYAIPAGSVTLISPYTMHRHPRYWDQPDHFMPERFAPGQSEARPRFAYLPFGGGPRLCIGQPFALAEATLLLAALAQRYTLRLVPGTVVKPEPRITLGMASPLAMTLSPR